MSVIPSLSAHTLCGILRRLRRRVGFLAISVAERVGLTQLRIRARLQSCRRVLYLCHPERTLFREGSAIFTFLAVSIAVCFCAWPTAAPAQLSGSAPIYSPSNQPATQA